MRTKLAKWSVLLLLLVGLPLIGAILAGRPLERYLEFPPTTRYVEHGPFSWSAFLLLALPVFAVVIPLLGKVLRGPKPDRPRAVDGSSFPWWGWLGVGVVALGWVFAWTRFSWFEELQPFTFTPPWIGYILVINALTFRRSGRCMMLDRPRYFLGLFPLSAAFWWFFEYLNRFVQNWYYVGIEEFTPQEYFWYATPAFATVLPAVLGTRDLLATFPRLSSGLHRAWPLDIKHAPVIGWSVLVLACLGLMGIGIWPDYLFPLLWVSPFLILTSLQAVLGEETIFSGIRHGDWRPIWLPALAGLVCGFFWEMWNYKSLAHWEYAVPFVHRFEIFEMPLLGYAGYLPFGLECVVIAAFFLPSQERNTG